MAGNGGLIKKENKKIRKMPILLLYKAYSINLKNINIVKTSLFINCAKYQKLQLKINNHVTVISRLSFRTILLKLIKHKKKINRLRINENFSGIIINPINSSKLK